MEQKVWFCRCIFCNALWARDIQKSHVTKTRELLSAWALDEWEGHPFTHHPLCSEMLSCIHFLDLASPKLLITDTWIFVWKQVVWTAKRLASQLSIGMRHCCTLLQLSTNRNSV